MNAMKLAAKGSFSAAKMAKGSTAFVRDSLSHRVEELSLNAENSAIVWEARGGDTLLSAE
jgi:hypothetical protein